MKIRNIICLLLVVFLTVGFCACGNTADNDGKANGGYVSEEDTQIEGSKLTSENVVGTAWQCTYHTDDGDKIYTRFWLYEDGTYKQLIAINELFDRYDNGTYEVKDSKLYLYLNGDTSSSTVYEYKKGNLTNNGNEYTPYSE